MFWIFALSLASVLPNKETRAAPALAHMVMAELAVADSDWHQAEQEVRLALVFDHDSVFLRTLLSRVLFHEGKFGSARDEYQKTLQPKLATEANVVSGPASFSQSTATTEKE